MNKDQLIEKCKELGIELSGDETNPVLKDLISKKEKELKEANSESDSSEGVENEEEGESNEDSGEPGDSGEGANSSTDQKSGETDKTDDTERGSEDRPSTNKESSEASSKKEKVLVIGNKNFITKCGVHVYVGKEALISHREYVRLTERDKRGLVKKA